jgi:uncharacterized coiled-coil protein SlyX
MPCQARKIGFSPLARGCNGPRATGRHLPCRDSSSSLERMNAPSPQFDALQRRITTLEELLMHFESRLEALDEVVQRQQSQLTSINEVLRRWTLAWDQLGDREATPRRPEDEKPPHY